MSAELAVDPDALRRERAQVDVDVVELMREPLSLEAALKAHAAETITGTVIITFETDKDDRVRRRTRIRTVRIAWPGGRVDTQTVTDTLVRTPLPRG